MAQTFSKYGCQYWRAGTTALAVEMQCIRQGGRWVQPDGTWAGEGLFHHYREMHRLLWPDSPEHKWTELVLREFTDMVEKRKRGMVGLLGPASTGKTFSAAKFALSHYFVFPTETTVLITTTTIQKLDLGIFGEVKKLFMEAREQWPDAPGMVLDYKRCITTRPENDVRDIRNGIIGIACYKGEQWIGIGPFVGTCS